MAAMACALLLLAGCKRDMSAGGTTPGANGATNVPTSPDATQNTESASHEILKRTVAAYRSAQRYSDRGQVRLSFTRNGRRNEQAWPAAVQFERPGRLRLEVYSLNLASDATSTQRQLRARVADVESNNIDNQMVVRPAPAEISLDALALDSILFSQLVGRFQRPPVQLELLLAPEPLASLFTKEVKLTALADAEAHDRKCHRVKATTAEGNFIFWIDAENHLVRRLEYPVEALLPDLATDPLVTEAELITEMPDSTFSPPENALDFSLPIPRDARQVRAFVLPPIAPFEHMLGKPLPHFEFASLSGGQVSPQSLEGKVAALLWYAHHPVCEEPVKQFAAATAALPEGIVAYAVCTEPTDVGDKAVREQLADWNVKLAPARDLKEFRSRVFQVRDLPAITLIDAEGRLQWVEAGPTAIGSFPKALERLARGENLAEEIIRQQRNLRAQYERIVANGGPAIDTGIAPAYPPERLKLEQAWKLDKVASPGSLAVLADDDARHLLVVSGGAKVVELSLDGTTIATHELELPGGANVRSLRVAWHDGKPVYALFSPLQPGVYVFDHDWKPKFVFPPEATDALDVRDVRFSDLDSDGEPELLVAFTDNAGLHAVSLAAERLWANRVYAPVLSISPFHRLAYVTGRGGICPIDRNGRDGTPHTLPGWTVAHVTTADFSQDSQALHLAVAVSREQEPCLVGLDIEMNESWNVPLSGSLFKDPVDFVDRGTIRKDSNGEWIVGWGDGVVHFVSEDGTFDDSFGTGDSIRGIALARHGDRPLLVITSPTAVTAWHISE
jgi:hypothetical protein